MARGRQTRACACEWTKWRRPRRSVRVKETASSATGPVPSSECPFSDRQNDLIRFGLIDFARKSGFNRKLRSI